MPKLISPSGHALALPSLPCRIGTAKTNHVPIQEGLGVAGHHVTFLQRDEFVVIEDSGSGLGTYINGSPVARQVLQGGESVRIGCLELRFEHDGQHAAPSQPQTPQPIQEQVPPKSPQAAPLPAPTAPAQPDQRAGLPPVDNKPAEAPLKDLFPKPSQGDRPALGEVKRREKPQLSDAGNATSKQASSQVKLGNLGKPNKTPRRWLPVTVAAIAFTGLITVGILVFKPGGLEKNSSAAIPSSEADAPATNTNPDGTYSRLAGLLASMTRPAAVITVDVSALRQREWTIAVPRIANWFQKYLKLPINDVEKIIAVGAAA